MRVRGGQLLADATRGRRSPVGTNKAIAPSRCNFQLRVDEEILASGGDAEGIDADVGCILKLHGPPGWKWEGETMRCRSEERGEGDRGERPGCSLQRRAERG